jgi:hypothetical protein
VSTRPNLYRIDLGTATYARSNTADVIFHLRADSTSQSDIVRVMVPGPEIQNERPTSIIFPPLADSQGKTYYFFIESPQATPGNAITLYGNQTDVYSEGTAYRDGQAVTGDLVFTAYSQDNYTFSDVLRDFGARVAQDVSFFTAYAILMLSVSVWLGVSWLRSLRMKDR